MKDKNNNRKQQKPLEIKEAEDFKEKIKVAYDEWAQNGFAEEWIIEFKNTWSPDTNHFIFIELLKAKKELNENEYSEKEQKEMKDFERREKDF